MNATTHPLGGQYNLTLERMLALSRHLKSGKPLVCGYVVQPGMANQIYRAVIPEDSRTGSPYNGLFGLEIYERNQVAPSYQFTDRKLMIRYASGHLTELGLLCHSRVKCRETPQNFVPKSSPKDEEHGK